MYNIIYTLHSIYAETNIIYKERLQFYTIQEMFTMTHCFSKYTKILKIPK